MVAVEQIEISKSISLEIIDNKMKEIESETKRQRKVLQKVRFVTIAVKAFEFRKAVMDSSLEQE